MKLSDQELIAIGLQVQEARRKGGKTIYKMYGKEHFSKLGKLSAEKKRLLRGNNFKLQENIRSDVKELFDKGMYASEIARKLNISRQRVHQLLTGYRTISDKKLKEDLLSNGCARCSKKAVAVHHIDGNSKNNDKSNLLPVCLEDHTRLHGSP